jgi:epoxyqueuosine reductase
MQHATALGFAACGVASLEPSRYGEALDRWLAAGYGGSMRYLHRQARRRREPASIVPGARTAVVVLENYLPEHQTGEQKQSGVGSSRAVKIAKYARGTDYHRALKHRLEQLAAWLGEQGATITRTFADAGPVPERELAARAGLGWIGKNTMLIRPGAGSFFLIGSIFTDLAFETAAGRPGGETAGDSRGSPDSGPSRSPAVLPPDRCGSCTRCLDACPTGALLEPRVLDATRCISYHTIESRASIPDPVADRIEGWAFGCDICNDVCPWNTRFAEPTARPEYRDRGDLRTSEPGFFEEMSAAEFARRFADTPLERPGLAGMRRNWRAAFRSLAQGPSA